MFLSSVARLKGIYRLCLARRLTPATHDHERQTPMVFRDDRKPAECFAQGTVSLAVLGGRVISRQRQVVDRDAKVVVGDNQPCEPPQNSKHDTDEEPTNVET